MNIDIKLEQYGWNEEWNRKWTDKLRLLDDREYAPGRIAGDFGSKYKVITAAGELWGELSGKFRHSLSGSGEYPAVGDWVVLAMQDGGAHAVIHGVLPVTASSRARWRARRRRSRLWLPMWIPYSWSVH